METEFPQSEKITGSGMHTPLPKLRLKANVLMWFAKLPKVFSF